MTFRLACKSNCKSAWYFAKKRGVLASTAICAFWKLTVLQSLLRLLLKLSDSVQRLESLLLIDHLEESKHDADLLLAPSAVVAVDASYPSAFGEVGQEERCVILFQLAVCANACLVHGVAKESVSSAWLRS